MATHRSQPGSQPAPGPADKASPTGGSGAGSAGGAAADIIVFYCPSGHKLNAPSRLQGSPGQCPHCGEKFRIPSYEEDQVEEPVEELAESEAVGPGDFLRRQLAELEEIEEFPEAHEELDEIQDEIVDIDVEADLEEVSALDDGLGLGTSAAGGRIHALARVFTRLWDRRRQDGSVDLYLAEGELLSPEFFSPQLSQSTHAVFADRMDDGTYSVISVPWESIKKAVLRKVDRLPDGLFH
jgi:hypothetical protein